MPNNVVVYNDHLVIEDFSSDVKEFADRVLTYTDKSKQYQLRRMSRSVWQRNSPAYAQLKKEVKGSLYQEIGNKLVMSSCFVNTLQGELGLFISADNRTETGKKIALPWVNKSQTLRDYQDE